jgi:hypothetical protein
MIFAPPLTARSMQLRRAATESYWADILVGKNVCIGIAFTPSSALVEGAVVDRAESVDKRDLIDSAGALRCGGRFGCGGASAQVLRAAAAGSLLAGCEGQDHDSVKKMQCFFMNFLQYFCVEERIVCYEYNIP